MPTADMEQVALKARNRDFKGERLDGRCLEPSLAFPGLPVMGRSEHLTSIGRRAMHSQLWSVTIAWH